MSPSLGSRAAWGRPAASTLRCLSFTRRLSWWIFLGLYRRHFARAAHRVCRQLRAMPGAPPRAAGLAYAAVAGVSSALNNVFVTYYLEAHTRAAPLPPWLFTAVMLVYMAWNATNDPLFGWISDLTRASRTSAQLKSGLPRPRLLRSDVIRWGGTLYAWALVFALLPLPASWPAWLRAAHLAIALVVYDGCLTLTEVNHGALLAEVVDTDAHRAQFNMMAGIAAAVGSGTSLLAHAAWRAGAGSSPLDTPFTLFLLALALVCTLAVHVSAGVLSSSELHLLQASRSPVHSSPAHAADDDGDADGARAGAMDTLKDAAAPAYSLVQRRGKPGLPSAVPNGSSSAGGALSFVQLLRQLCSRRSVQVYMCVSALQSFDCAFEKNFFVPFMSVLTRVQALDVDVTGRSAGVAWVSTAVLSLSFVLPHALTVAWTPVITAEGTAATLTWIFLIRLGVLGAARLLGSSTDARVLWFMLTNRVLSESVCRLSPLLVSDLIDEDAALAQRPRQYSATVIGSTAFAGKLTQSIAPMIAYAMLHSSSSEDMDRSLVWQLLWTLPALCVVVQLVVWRYGWPLRGSHLAAIRAQLAGFKDEEQLDA